MLSMLLVVVQNNPLQNDPLKEGYCFHILTDGMSEELRAIYEVNCQSIRGERKASYLKRAWQRYLHLLYAL